MLFGFGIEKIGLAAFHRPVVASIVVLVVTLLALAGIARLGYSGANVDILRDGSQEIADYDELLNSFRNFNNDAVVLIRGESLDTVAGIETYRDLHFEYQFDPMVQSVLSLFSLVQYDAADGGWRSALPARFENDAAVRAALQDLADQIPNSKSLFDPAGGSAVIVVYVDPRAVRDAEVRETVRRFQAIAEDFQTEDLRISIAGQPAIRSDMIISIVDDMMTLLPIAALLCALIAFAIFRNLAAMTICVAAPILSLIWLLGGMGLAGRDINFLTNILPVLIVVVVFADTLHIFLKWSRLRQSGAEFGDSVRRAIGEVGPACVLSAITTAVALLSLIVSGNEGLAELGIVGGTAILASLVAVLVVTPLAIYWTNRAGLTIVSPNALSMTALVRPAIALFRYRSAVVASGMILAIIGLVAHFQIDSRFRLVDYLSESSSVAQGEKFIDEAYPGSTPLFAIVRLDDTKPTLDPDNLDRFYSTLAAVGEVFPSTSFYSLADFRDELEKGGGEIREEDFDELPDYLTARFISPERDKALITIFSSANLEAAEMRGRVEALREVLAQRGLGEHVAVTGYPVLSAIVAPRLMDNLRVSLLAAIVLSILLIMVCSGSWRRGLACLVPNVLPIVSVELVLWAAGVPLNMSITVALTVAFGLAVNDSIHLLNEFSRQARDQEPQSAMTEALRQVLPAMLSTTLILVGGLIIMMFSSLPVIVLFSAVMILTLIFAIVFDIFQLPGHLLVLERSGVARNSGVATQASRTTHHKEVNE